VQAVELKVSCWYFFVAALIQSYCRGSKQAKHSSTSGRRVCNYSLHVLDMCDVPHRGLVALKF
jgi:hypothetical protein